MQNNRTLLQIACVLNDKDVIQVLINYYEKHYNKLTSEELLEFESYLAIGSSLLNNIVLTLKYLKLYPQYEIEFNEFIRKVINCYKDTIILYFLISLF